ncbi:hypothetical protein OIU74_020737 [Salix koriyanagi]|uniref:Uncharacterized protein n=1 Tax=Salix koriyanagi TaxID=2511006 RepID=A0A9Q0P6Q7_9ROSI|nr:hypothetical protein OIU74_020737 [Salix koriyanagi]
MPVPARIGITPFDNLFCSTESPAICILSTKFFEKFFPTTHIIERELSAKLQIKQTIMDAYRSFVEAIISTTNCSSLLKNRIHINACNKQGTPQSVVSTLISEPFIPSS